MAKKRSNRKNGIGDAMKDYHDKLTDKQNKRETGVYTAIKKLSKRD